MSITFYVLLDALHVHGKRQVIASYNLGSYPVDDVIHPQERKVNKREHQVSWCCFRSTPRLLMFLVEVEVKEVHVKYYHGRNQRRMILPFRLKILDILWVRNFV